LNESSRQEEVINDLNQGLSIALISDAGTPGISDPGSPLIVACVTHHSKVAAIPGAAQPLQHYAAQD